MFTGISYAHCRKALELVVPSIEHAANVELTNKLAGTFVVLDPRKRCILATPQECLEAEIFVGHITSEDGNAMFYAAAGGQEGASTNKYLPIARAKAFLTFKHRLPSSVIQQLYPYLYEAGDTKWGGSTIDAGGLIVAFSGVQAVYDEMFAEWMVSAIRAQCRFDMTNPDNGVMAATSAIIGN